MAGFAVFRVVGDSAHDDCRRQTPCPSVVDQERIEWAVFGFVMLGAALRIAHYLMNYPLWGDEAFLAVNFIRRGYLELLTPLEYGQIAPILFLWAELTAVKLFGFSELSLRLVPLLCAVASMFLFRHVAARLLSGVALLMAVAIFAVSIHPIRHAADAKPYALDLLIALALLGLAVEWLRRPERTGMFWALVGFLPMALAASYPAAIVASGIAIALAPSVWRTWRWAPRIGLAVYVLTLVATLTILSLVNPHRQQAGALMPALLRYWADGFPPLDSPFHLMRWLITTHAGSMLAYPWGGGRGASSGTFVLVIIAAIVLWRRGQHTVILLLVMPMVVALGAAALRLYPYGVQARIMQYIAPSVCLLAGAGLATVLGRPTGATARATAVRITAATLALAGTATVIDGARHPYRALYDQQAREFARHFWAEQSRDAELACLQWDFGIRQRRTAVARTAIYLCNQHIYSPSRRHQAIPSWSSVTADHPLRCVVFDDTQLKSAEAAAWLDSMEKSYHCRRRFDLVVPTTGLDGKPWDDRVFVFEFEPKRVRPAQPAAIGAMPGRNPL
jgi:hypothetical protein